MLKMDIFLLDNLNNTKEVVKIIKPKTFEGLLHQINRKFRNLSEYYDLFIIDKNNKEIKIDREEEYFLVEDILFIREINKEILGQSNFEININKLPQSKKDVFEEKYICKICTFIIKNENPLFCYNCQKIFHEKCLAEWDRRCSLQNRNLQCPHCRNNLALENWKKKLDYEDNRKEIAELIEKINENKLNNYMNIIRDKKINELKIKNSKQHELIKKYEKYIEKTIEIFKYLLNEINIINFILKLKNNNKLNELIIKYPLNLQNLEINDISEVIIEKLLQFKNYIINYQELELNEIMINYHKEMKKLKKSIIYNNNNKINQNNINKNINENSSLNDKRKDKIIHNNYINNDTEKNNLIERNENIEQSDKNIHEFKTRIELIYYTSIKGNYIIFGKEFVENNKIYIELIINGQRNSLIHKAYLNQGNNIIIMIIKAKLLNLSHMFHCCNHLKNIDELKYLRIEDSNNMSYMFSECNLLSDLQALQNWNVSNCTNLESMFDGCISLISVEHLKKWNVSNCTNFSFMFHGCSSLSNIYGLQNWNVSKGINFSGMFQQCTSLNTVNNLFNWNVSNAETFEDMFRDCQTLNDIRFLENWDVSKCNDFSGMFWGCTALYDINALKNWNVTDENNIEDMFFGCSNKLDISPLNNWKVSKNNLKSVK